MPAEEPRLRQGAGLNPPVIKTLIETQRSEGLKIGDAEVAAVLRRVETGARQARQELSVAGDVKNSYLQLLKRVMRVPPASDPAKDEKPGPGSGLIVPG